MKYLILALMVLLGGCGTAFAEECASPANGKSMEASVNVEMWKEYQFCRIANALEEMSKK